MAENTIIELLEKAAKLRISHVFQRRCGGDDEYCGDYNMKFMGVWITFQASMSANLEAPILLVVILFILGR